MQTTKYTSIIVKITLIITLGLFGCSDNGTGPGGDDNDLSESEQEIVGTWKHISSEGGLGDGLVPGTFTWTFNADRTGTYYQNPEGASEQSSSFNWKLDGDDIVFYDESTSNAQYRIEERSGDQMRWYNYSLAGTDYAYIYIVERQ